MNILHVISSLDTRKGGPPAALRGLALAQRNLGLDIMVVTTYREHQDTKIEQELFSADVTVHNVGPIRLPLGMHHDLRPTLAKVIAQADAVHIHGLWEDIQHKAAVEARKQGKPYIISPHGMLAPWSLKQSMLRKHLYMAWRLNRDMAFASTLHFTTPSEARQASHFCKGRQPIIEPLAVFMRDFETTESRNDVRERWGVADDRLVIAFMGRIHPGKGLEYLVPAMAKIRELDPLLVIIGPDSDGYKNQIDLMIQEFKFERNIFFTDMLSGSDRNAALKAADIFALPSDHENFGLAVIEAMGCGLPVIISPEVAVCDLLENTEAVRISDRDPENLALSITRLAADREKLFKLRQEAKSIARDRFSWGTVAQNWIQHWENILYK